MRLKSASLMIASALAASSAHAGSSSVTMGVGLTIVADCSVSHCGAPSRPALRQRTHLNIPVSTAPHYVTIRTATEASAGNITLTY